MVPGESMVEWLLLLPLCILALAHSNDSEFSEEEGPWLSKSG